MGQISTKSVTDRRNLQFESLEQLRNDVNRLAQSERGGRLRASGNWSLGQACGHLASWIELPYEGYPPELNPPWIVRAIVKLRKNSYLNKRMPPGVRIPGIQGGTLGTEPMATDAGVARLDAALKRLAAGPPAVPNIIFGPLTHEEWKRLNLRHAELHLSFFHPG